LASDSLCHLLGIVPSQADHRQRPFVVVRRKLLVEDIELFSPILTERLELRPLTPDDAECLFAYRSDPNVAKYQGWQPRTLIQTREFINKLSDVAPDTPGTWFQCALVHRASGELVGDCGLHFVKDDLKQCEIGITVSRSHQRNGYASEAVHAALEYLFVGLSKHRVFASIDPRNTSAIELFKRVGMRQEAHFVESLWLNEEWVDDLIFAMLDREWRPRRRA
jgi:RimJ/RimL family protein N-acetyltransferase